MITEAGALPAKMLALFPLIAYNARIEFLITKEFGRNGPCLLTMRK